MKTSTMQRMIIAAFTVGASASAIADPEPKSCSESLVHGTYGIQMQGTNLAPEVICEHALVEAPGGAPQNVIGVVVRYYDGHGGITQFDNIKGSITGLVPNRFGTGTYQVNEDCTVDMLFQPAPGVLIQEKAVIVDNGQELRSITVLPVTTMVTAVHRKI